MAKLMAEAEWQLLYREAVLAWSHEGQELAVSAYLNKRIPALLLLNVYLLGHLQSIIDFNTQAKVRHQ